MTDTEVEKRLGILEAGVALLKRKTEKKSDAEKFWYNWFKPSK